MRRRPITVVGRAVGFESTKATLGALALGVVVGASACQGGSAPPEILPGRTRPFVKHEWLHPRAFHFAPARFAAPDPEKALVTTESGLRAFVVPDASDGLVRITAALQLGRAYEQSDEAGASGLLASTLRRPLSAEAILDSMPRRLEVEERVDVTILTVEVLPEDWDEALRLVIERLRGVDVDETARAAYRTGGSSIGARVDPAAADFLPRVELERILGPHARTGVAPGSAVSSNGVRSVAARTLDPSRVVLGVGGQVQADAVARALHELTRPWKNSSGPITRTPVAPVTAGASFHLIDNSSLEGWIAIGRLVGDVPPSERAPLAVLAQILNTRLNIATREIRGLTNRAMVTLPDSSDGAGLLYVSTGGRSEAVAPLIRFCWDELARLHDPGEALTDEELTRAKGALILGEWQGLLDGARQASATYAIEMVRSARLDELLQWPLVVERTTAQQVKAAASKYLNPHEMVTVVAGPIEQIRRARHPRWPITLDEVRGSSPAGH
jgi:predicted Zn-dependent peptidase